MSESIRVKWYINFNQENEYKVAGVLLEILKDDRGYYARVDDGSFDGPFLVDLWRFDKESYEKARAAYPHLWR